MLAVLMTSPDGPGFGFPPQLLLMLAIFSIFYFIVFRPMKKRQQDTERMLKELRNGDRVLTNGGIYGTVVSVGDDQIQLRVAEHVKIQVAKSAITRLVEESAGRG